MTWVKCTACEGSKEVKINERVAECPSCSSNGSLGIVRAMSMVVGWMDGLGADQDVLAKFFRIKNGSDLNEKTIPMEDLERLLEKTCEITKEIWKKLCIYSDHIEMMEKRDSK